MNKMRLFTLLATTAALAMCATARAADGAGEGPDVAIDPVEVGVVPEEPVQVVDGAVDAGPVIEAPDSVDPEVVYYTMASGPRGIEPFERSADLAGDDAADQIADQAADRVLDRVDQTASAHASSDPE